MLISTASQPKQLRAYIIFLGPGTVITPPAPLSFAFRVCWSQMRKLFRSMLHVSSSFFVHFPKCRCKQKIEIQTERKRKNSEFLPFLPIQHELLRSEVSRAAWCSPRLHVSDKKPSSSRERLAGKDSLARYTRLRTGVRWGKDIHRGVCDITTPKNWVNY